MSFAVTAGGGSVERTSGTTGTDGTASPGRWTLGPAEGENRLEATVSGLPAATATARARIPAVTVLESGVAAGGATVTVRRPGDPADGLTLRVPPGALRGPSQWKIAHRPASTLPANLNARGVVLEITTDQTGYADSLIALSIPVVVADSVPVVFLRHPVTGAVEPLPIAGYDGRAVTVLSRHFSADLMLAAAPAAAESFRSAAAGGGFVNVFLVYLSQSALGQGQTIASSFRTNNDDWEYPNHGSYLTSAGLTTGRAISAFYYFTRQKTGALGLAGRFDQGPAWADNPGYRIAALAERDVDWPSVRAALASAPTIGGLSPDQTLLLTVAGAFQSLGQPPVLIALDGPLGPVVLIAEAVSLAGIRVADPTNALKTALLPFSNGRFQPLRLAPIVGGNLVPYTNPRLLGFSAVIPTSRVSARFTELAQGRVGVTEFPAHSLQYFDEDFGVWKDLPTSSLRVTWQDVALRAFCPSCDRHLTGSGVVAGQTGFDVYDHLGNVLGTDRGAGRVDFRVPGGKNRIGVHVLGSCQSCGTNWRHVDFTYLQIESSQYYITPDPVSTQPNRPITLTARNLASTPAGLRYDWRFDDGQTARVDGDSVVTHAWTLPGSYTVSVTISEIQTGLKVARATARVNVGQPAPIWQLSSWRLVRITPPGGVTQREFTDDQAYGEDALFFHGLTGGAAPSGMLFYLDSPQTIGGTTYAPGVHLQLSPNNNPVSGLNPTLKSRALALAPVPGLPHPDRLQVTGTLDTGTIAGHAHRFLAASFNLAAPWITWEISSTKVGVQLTGTVIRTHNFVSCTGGFSQPPGGGPPKCNGNSFVATELREYAITARRVQ